MECTFLSPANLHFDFWLNPSDFFLVVELWFWSPTPIWLLISQSHPPPNLFAHHHLRSFNFYTIDSLTFSHYYIGSFVSYAQKFYEFFTSHPFHNIWDIGVWPDHEITHKKEKNVCNNLVQLGTPFFFSLFKWNHHQPRSSSSRARTQHTSL